MTFDITDVIAQSSRTGGKYVSHSLTRLVNPAAVVQKCADSAAISDLVFVLGPFHTGGQRQGLKCNGSQTRHSFDPPGLYRVAQSLV